MKKIKPTTSHGLDTGNIMKDGISHSNIWLHQIRTLRQENDAKGNIGVMTGAQVSSKGFEREEQLKQETIGNFALMQKRHSCIPLLL